MDIHIAPIPPRSISIYRADVHDRFITFTDVSAISTTFTTNETSLPILLNGQYVTVISDSTTVLHSVGYIKMSLFTDASGINFAQDSSGNPIDNKLVISTVYTYPYTDICGNAIDGYLTTIFSDGTYFGNNDTNDAAYWYTLEGLDTPPQQYT
jgi:hypothetical protein